MAFGVVFEDLLNYIAFLVIFLSLCQRETMLCFFKTVPISPGAKSAYFSISGFAFKRSYITSTVRKSILGMPNPGSFQNMGH